VGVQPIQIEFSCAAFKEKNTWLYPHKFFSFLSGFIDSPFLVLSFLKGFSVLLFQGVLYFPVKAKKEAYIGLKLGSAWLNGFCGEFWTAAAADKHLT